MPLSYRQFGATGLKVSELGLGCSPLGGGLFRYDGREAREVLHAALDLGINFFDTADNYSVGESERLLGRALRGRRERAVIATKGGAVFGAADRLLLRGRPLLRPLKGLLRGARRSINLARDQRKRYDYSPQHLARAVESSLRRLGTDYIDLYQIYNPTAESLRNSGVIETLDRLKDSGKIRHYGIAANDLEDAAEILEQFAVASVQVAVSLLDQQPLKALLGEARARGVAVIASAPLGQGLLTDASGPAKADESSHFTTQELHTRRVRASACRRWVRPGRSLAQTALRFALQCPGISVVIPSAVTRAELIENWGASAAPPLSSDELTAIARTLG